MQIKIQGQKNQNQLSPSLNDLNTALIFDFKLDQIIKDKNTWLPYQLSIKTPSFSQSFESKNFVLCLNPKNEISFLKLNLSDFLNSEKLKFIFEAIEPCFELKIKRVEKGFKLYFWLDSGNTDFEYYTWDALGLRLFVGEEELKDLINSIEILEEKLQKVII